MNLQCFYLIKSKELGPMIGSEMVALAKMGWLSATDMVRQENSGRLLPLGDLTILNLVPFHLTKNK